MQLARTMLFLARSISQTTRKYYIMKINALIRTLLLGSALSAGSLFANTLSIYNTSMDGGLPGGEFKVVSAELGTFYTFCLEHGAGVALPGTYSYTIELAAKNQGPLVNAPDTLSVGSAWLYEQFYYGNLSGPTGSGNYYDNQYGWYRARWPEQRLHRHGYRPFHNCRSRSG
jgi:hypothetical protein